MSAKWNKEKSVSVSHWREYRDTIYEEELLPRQETECSRAFYAGMMAAFTLMMKTAEHDEPEEVGAARLEGLRVDISQAAHETVTTPRR